MVPTAVWSLIRVFVIGIVIKIKRERERGKSGKTKN